MSGRGGGAWWLVPAAVVAAAIAKPLARAAGEVGHALAVVGIVVVCAIGAVVVTGLGIVVYRVCWWAGARRVAEPVRAYQVAQGPAEALPAPGMPAIEAAREIHYHIHVGGAEDAAAVLHEIRGE
jgi:hypothetical protein